MRLQNNNSGIIEGIVGLIIIILCATVVLLIVAPGIRNSFTSFFHIADKFLPAKPNYNNTFMFTAQQIRITSDSGCAVVGNAADNTFSCPAGKVVNFEVSVWNDGLKQRTFFGRPKACLLDSNEACQDSAMFDIPQSAQECVIIPQQTTWCGGGNYIFPASGTNYRIYPGVICTLDSTYGCYDPSMTSNAQYVNFNNYITILAGKI